MKKQINTICCILLCITLCLGCGAMLSFAHDAYAEISFANTAKSAILMDYNTKTIIYEKDKNKKLPIASMVKLMTIYLTFKSIDEGIINPEQKITTSEKASGMGGSQVFIDPYVSYKVEDLLKSVIMASANDASVALAEAISGSEDEFVNLMNKTAKELNMNNTKYANCTGLPAPEQYSTAEDCGLMLVSLLKYEDYHKYSNVWMDELIHPSGRKTELVNTNKLIRYFDGCDSGKTGSTSEAGYCLTASAKKNNLRLISVIIGAKTGNDRFKESTDLLNYGFANYENKHLVVSGNILKELPTLKCKQTTAKIVAEEDYFAFDKKGNKSNYEISYSLPECLGKTKKGQKVGEMIISKDGNVVKVINLTVNENLEQLTIKDNFKNIIKNW